MYETVFEVKDKQVSFFRDMPECMKRHFSHDKDHYVMHAEMTINGTKVWIGDTVSAVTLAMVRFRFHSLRRKRFARLSTS